MTSPLFRSALYAIIDRETFHRQGVDILEGARALLRGGCKVIQYRDKISEPAEIARTAFSLLRCARSHNATLVLNDAVQTFMRLYGHSIKLFAKYLAFHFGQQDSIPTDLTIPAFGLSTHNTEEIRQALRAIRQPDYIGFGSVFHSPTKPMIRPVLHEVNRAAALWPGHLVLIGGINIANLRELNNQLPHQNRFSYAVISDLFRFGNKPQDLEQYAIEFEHEVRLL